MSNIEIWQKVALSISFLLGLFFNQLQKSHEKNMKIFISLVLDSGGKLMSLKYQYFNNLLKKKKTEKTDSNTTFNTVDQAGLEKMLLHYANIKK